MTGGLTYSLVAVILQIIGGVLAWLDLLLQPTTWLMISSACGMVAAASALAHIFPELVKRVGPLPRFSCFRLTMGFFVFICVAIIGLPSVFPDYTVEGYTSPLDPAPEGSTFDVNHVAPGVLAGVGAYPICNNMHWDSSKPRESQLTALDLFAFANALYAGSEERVLQFIENATKNTELYPVKLEYLQDRFEVARLGIFTMPSVKTRQQVRINTQNILRGPRLEGLGF